MLFGERCSFADDILRLLESFSEVDLTFCGSWPCWLFKRRGELGIDSLFVASGDCSISAVFG